MSQKEIEESLDLLQKDWDVDPILRNFMLGKITDVSDRPIKVKDVVFHVPYLNSEKKFILWKCFWPDCHNCCDRQGRLPLTSDDLITIGKGLKYQKPNDTVINGLSDWRQNQHTQENNHLDQEDSMTEWLNGQDSDQQTTNH